jgi:hypothetical protein
VIAVGALEAWIAWLLTLLDAAKEGLEGTVQTGEHILQYLGVDVVVLQKQGLTGPFFVR